MNKIAYAVYLFGLDCKPKHNFFYVMIRFCPGEDGAYTVIFTENMGI